MNDVVFLNIQFVTHTIRIAVKLFCTPALPVLMRFEAMQPHGVFKHAHLGIVPKLPSHKVGKSIVAVTPPRG